MTDHPADLLAAAAHLLRDRATTAANHGGPTWTYRQTLDSDQHGGYGTVRTADGHRVAGGGAITGHRQAPGIIRPYGEWIATMDPATGILIADWLEDEAGFQRNAAAGAEDSERALAVARAVLGQDGAQ